MRKQTVVLTAVVETGPETESASMKVFHTSLSHCCQSGAVDSASVMEPYWKEPCQNC